MLITEAIDGVMNWIISNGPTEKWIYESRLFYKNNVLVEFKSDLNFNRNIIYQLIDKYNQLYDENKLSRSRHDSFIRWLKLLLDYNDHKEYCHIYRKKTWKFNPGVESLDIINNILSSRASSDKKCRYLETYMRMFFVYLENKNIKVEDIDNDTIINYIYEKKSEYHDLSDVINALSVIVEYFQKNNLCDISLNPELVKLRKHHHSIIAPFVSGDISRIVDYALKNDGASGARFAAIVYLAAFTGIRGCDIINLKYEDIDWINHNISFVQQKTNIPVILPVPEKALNAIADYIISYRRKPLNREDDHFIFTTMTIPVRRMKKISSISVQINRYAKILNIEIKNGQGLHSVRRLFATKLVNSQVDTKIVSQMLGHVTFSSDKSYMSYNRALISKCALNFEKVPIKGGVYYRETKRKSSA